MIRLRPHHLLCMLTYSGEGYSPEFSANFDRIASSIAAGNQTVEIVFGPDDVCAPILGDADCHCRNASVDERDRLAAEALGELLHQPLNGGAKFKITGDKLDRMREAFAKGTIRKACQGCQWSRFCDGIASGGFAGTRLLCDR